MYKVIVAFADLQDGNYIYRHGDIYPRAGYNPKSERIKELSCSGNRLNRPLIEAVAENPKPEDAEPTKADDESKKTVTRTRRKTTK